MKALSTFQDSFHIKAINDTKKLAADLLQRMKQRDDRDELVRYQRSESDRIMAEYAKGRTETIDAVNKQAERIRESYATTEYKDPQQEVLNRQDWDIKVRAAENSAYPLALSDLVDGLNSGKTNAYQVQTLGIAVRSSNKLSPEQRESLTQSIDKYEATNHVMEPWLNDSDYVKLQEHASALQKTPSKYLWQQDSTGEWQPFTAQEATKPVLDGYNVSLH